MELKPSKTKKGKKKKKKEKKLFVYCKVTLIILG